MEGSVGAGDAVRGEAAGAPPPRRVFYSYSHKDWRFRDQLETHLTLLQRQGLIAGWSDRKISAGREWEGEIGRELEAADIILLLVSADFIASDYCYDKEMARALQRHAAREARVIPIIVRASDWGSSPLGPLQALPAEARPVADWNSRDRAWTSVADGIREVVRELNQAPPPVVADSPVRVGDVSAQPDELEIMRNVALYAGATSFRNAEQLGRTVILPMASQLSSIHVVAILGVAALNRQIWDAGGTPGILQRLFTETRHHLPYTHPIWASFVKFTLSDEYAGLRAMVEDAAP